MYLTWSGPEGSSHTSLYTRVPFLLAMEHVDYMKMAIQEAKKAQEKGEVPIGAIVVKDGTILAKAHNLKETKRQANRHAEMIAIERASKKLGNYYLEGCTLYVTLEPCMMCTGAMVLARIPKVYYGCRDPKGGCMHTLIQLEDMTQLNHRIEIHDGLLQEECSQLLSNFFKERRRIKRENRTQSPK